MSDRESVARRPKQSGGGLVAYTGTASTAVVAPVDATAVYVYCSTAAHVSLGAKAAAETTDLPLPANVLVILQCQPGDKLSAVQQAAGGNLGYCWMV